MAEVFVRPTTRQEALRYGWLVRCVRRRVNGLYGVTGSAAICGGCAAGGAIIIVNISRDDGDRRWAGLCEICISSLRALIPKLPLSREVYDQLTRNHALCLMNTDIVQYRHVNVSWGCIWCGAEDGSAIHPSCVEQADMRIAASYKTHMCAFLWPRFISCYACGSLPREIVREICALLRCVFHAGSNKYWLAIEPVNV